MVYAAVPQCLQTVLPLGLEADRIVELRRGIQNAVIDIALDPVYIPLHIGVVEDGGKGVPVAQLAAADAGHPGKHIPALRCPGSSGPVPFKITRVQDRAGCRQDDQEPAVGGRLLRQLQVKAVAEGA